MKMQHLQIWFNKISIQFAHSKLCSLCPSLFLLASMCSFYFNFNLSLSRSPILCCLSCPLLQQSDTDSYHSLFFFFLSASTYKPENLQAALPMCWKWRENGKGVIMMSIHKRRTPRDCMDESTNATRKLPTQPGQVICDTVEQNNKHSRHPHMHAERKVHSGGKSNKRKWRVKTSGN